MAFTYGGVGSVTANVRNVKTYFSTFRSKFETRIAVKTAAPGLLRRAFDRPSWRGETVAFSGVSRCSEPSRCDLNRAPSSVTVRRSARLKT